MIFVYPTQFSSTLKSLMVCDDAMSYGKLYEH